MFYVLQNCSSCTLGVLIDGRRQFVVRTTQWCCVVLTWGAWGMEHAGVCHSPCASLKGQLGRQLPWHACHSCELLLPVTCDRKMLKFLQMMLTSVLVNDQHTGTDSFAMVGFCAQLATTLQ